ncbi:MAG TPA: glycosyltransferase family 4 protein [Thermoanaerobaculia bacterium]|nr:glycosyltransferase family 4 protein [Thermoanaerobaculia bacterium]
MTTVLYLAPFDPTAGSSGSAVRALLILRFLAERYETHVVHLEGRDPGGRDEALAARLASLTAVPYSEAGYFVFSPALYQAAAELLRRRPVDFLFAEFEKAGGYAWLLSRRFGKPFFYASHNVEFLRSLDLARAAPLRLGLVPGLYVCERQACRDALSTFAISEADDEVFRSWAPEGRVSVLPLAFDDEVFHPFYEEDERDPPVVLMVGNYHYAATRDGARFVLDRVVPRVLERHPRAVFRFVGPGLLAPGPGANVEIPGFVDDLPAEYRRAAVVIAPITSGGGIKIKVVEALAMGRFLVTTPKAMEGIGGGLAHVAVAPLERFAEEISEALARRPGRSPANWEEVSRRHGARGALREMGERIEAALSGHGNC